MVKAIPKANTKVNGKGKDGGKHSAGKGNEKGKQKGDGKGKDDGKGKKFSNHAQLLPKATRHLRQHVPQSPLAK